MRALSVQELDALTASLAPLLGSRLQEVAVGATGVGLGLWTSGQGKKSDLIWVWFENHAWSPLCLPLNQLPEAGLKPLKPLALFLRAHFVGHRLRLIERQADLGRALSLEFGEETDGGRRVEIHLWPHGGNLVARAAGRTVAWKKVAPQVATTAKAPLHSEPPAARDLSQITEEWLVLRGQRQDRGAKAKPKDMIGPEKKRNSELKRLSRALERVEEEIQHKRSQPYREVGDWMVRHQNLDVPTAFAALVDKRRSLAWNIEHSFSLGKEIERKLSSTLARREKLIAELARMESLSAKDLANTSESMPRQRAVKKEGASARYRTLDLPNGVVARLGKSAQDNISLLKASRAWDIWLHLRGHPGSHAIISREKQRTINDEVLRQVGAALVEQTFGRKAESRRGERFELIVAECRFVKPVRGDQRGRVTYTHDRTIGFKFS